MERFLVVVVKSLHRFLESTAYKVSFFWNRERKQPFSFGGGGGGKPQNAFFGGSIV